MNGDGLSIKKKKRKERKMVTEGLFVSLPPKISIFCDNKANKG
jgi:hypothetical protein